MAENWRSTAYESTIYKDRLRYNYQSMVCTVFLSKCHICRKVGLHCLFLIMFAESTDENL